MKKGIVMEIDDVFLTLLTPEGEFLRARKQNQDYQLGEEINFYPVTFTKTGPFLNRFHYFFRAKPVLLTTLVIIIFMSLLFPLYRNDKAYAYLSIDVNPSIELGVNEKMQVIEMTGFNKEGKKLISRLSGWKKQDAAQLTKTLLIEMKKSNLLKEHNQVIFSTVRTEEVKKEAEERLQKNINEIKAAIHSQSLEVTVYSGTKQELKKAHQLGITAGKYQAKYQAKRKIQSIEKKNNGESRPTEQTKPVIPSSIHFKKQSGNSKGEAKQKQVTGKRILPQQVKKREDVKEKNTGQTKKVFHQGNHLRKQTSQQQQTNTRFQPKRALQYKEKTKQKNQVKRKGNENSSHRNKWMSKHVQRNSWKPKYHQGNKGKQKYHKVNKWKQKHHTGNKGKQKYHNRNQYLNQRKKAK